MNIQVVSTVAVGIARARRPQAETSRIIGMRAEGMTLQQIATEFGVTQERIWQILKANGIAGCIPKPEPPPRIIGFRVVMVRWLRWAGFEKCYGPCRLVKCDKEVAHKRCRECNAKIQRDRYRTDPEHRAKVKAYGRSPKARAYFKEYVKRPEVKERIKQHRQSPEVKAKNCKKQKEYYSKLRTDPARWEAYKKAQREEYRKRTEKRREGGNE